MGRDSVSKGSYIGSIDVMVVVVIWSPMFDIPMPKALPTQLVDSVCSRQTPSMIIPAGMSKTPHIAVSRASGRRSPLCFFAYSDFSSHHRFPRTQRKQP